MVRPINEELYYLHRPISIIEIEEDSMKVSQSSELLLKYHAGYGSPLTPSFRIFSAATTSPTTVTL